jgi:mannose/fructose/N-acetylgalactosamine-specific phosphotransferase system component IIC
MKRIMKYLYFTFCMMLMLTMPVHAYIDPSVMTYGIQVIAGVAIVVGTVVGVLWRRAKKKVQNKLGIDENAKKEVEEDVVFDDDDE